jgi:ABC-type phosphate transport system substrate-binding protein
MIGLVLCVALTASAARLAAEQPPEAPPTAYRVIVHPKNPLTSVDRRFLQDAFFKKVTRWPNDTVIRPADLRPNSTARSAFSQEVLARSVAAVKAYWQQRIFSGRGVPPPEFESEDRVVAYVLEYDGALGYVSASSDLKGAKAVTVIR